MVGKHIRKYRAAKKITQEQLAEHLNVTRQAVSNWENEKTQPDIDMLQKIAQILEVSVEELIYGTTKEKSEVVNNYISKDIRIVKQGVSIDAALAMVISYVKWESIGWAILHGLMNWFYVIYYIFQYGWS